MQETKVFRMSDEDSDDLVKISLMNRYKTAFIDRLTYRDLQELRFYLQNQFDKNCQWNVGYRKKFESKLRQYFHEEVIRREIASLEVLVGLLAPDDLKNPG